MNDAITAVLKQLIFEAVRDALKEQVASTLKQEKPLIATPESGLPAIMSPAQLAAELDVSVRTLERWRKSKSGPSYRHPKGTRIYRYLRNDVTEWLGDERK